MWERREYMPFDIVGREEGSQVMLFMLVRKCEG